MLQPLTPVERRSALGSLEKAVLRAPQVIDDWYYRRQIW
jgi:hypothetical protein